MTIAVILPALNEAGKIGRVVRKMPRDIVSEVVVVDDGSTDATAVEARAAGATVIQHAANRGVGAAIRTGIDHARASGHGVIVIAASDDQDEPAEIGRLVQPILTGTCDYVHGSRYLPGGTRTHHPLYRTLTTRLYSLAFTLLVRRRVTDGTNGFRAFRSDVLDDPRINLRQAWLDRYELEPYLYWSVLRRGYRVREVPVTKNYPRVRQVGYTKMRPWVDWWRILRPLLFLSLGWKR
jgi:dolichol-phosphate mannosyltransferase